MKASIIIRTYNSEQTIERAILSALNQNFPKQEFEVVVVNDGSTDCTGEILTKFKGMSGIRLFSQENKGGTAAANKGLSESKGKYVTVLDSDDSFEPTLLKELCGILDKRPDINFVYCDYYEVKDAEKKYVAPQNFFQTVAIGILFQKEQFEREGFYREGILFAEYDLLLRTLGKWRGYHHPVPLFTYFRRPDSATADGIKVQMGLGELKALHPDKQSIIDTIRVY